MFKTKPSKVSLVSLVSGALVFSNVKPASCEVRGINMVASLVITEAGFVGMSALAAKYPVAAGTYAGVLMPFGLESQQPEDFVALGAFELVPLYNIAVVDQSHMTRPEIFRNNLIAWHGAALLAMTLGHLVRQSRLRDIPVTPNIAPSRDGATFWLTHKF